MKPEFKKKAASLLDRKLPRLNILLFPIGCIFAEMANKRPLFQGDSEIGKKIYLYKNPD